MKNGEYRLKIVILAMAIAFLGLFGTYKIYNIYNIEKPLINTVETIPGVEQVTLDKTNGAYEIKIKLAKVTNFREKYRQIDIAVAKKMKPDSYTIFIEDKRNSKLNQFYDYAQLAIFQALNDDQYIWLDQALQQKAGSVDVNCKLLIDTEDIYIEAIDGTSYLYEIIPRSTTDETAPGGERIS